MTVEQFRKFMLFWAFSFLVVGLFFIIKPEITLKLMGLPSHCEYFWVALAGSMMMTISYLCYKGSQYPINHTAIIGVLVAKLSSSLFFLVATFRTANFLYLVGTAIDFPIFLIILFFYLKIRNL